MRVCSHCGEPVNPKRAALGYRSLSEPVTLEVEQLRVCRIVRPAGAVGTCGFFPKAWTVAIMERNDTPTEAFLRDNPNWSQDDIR